MPGSTTKRNYPYPTSADPMADTPAKIQQLAERVEQSIQSGIRTVTLNNQAYSTTTFTFDPPFVDPPVVVATSVSTNYVCATSANSNTSAQIAINHRSGTAATTTIDVRVIAVGKVAS